MKNKKLIFLAVITLGFLFTNDACAQTYGVKSRAKAPNVVVFIADDVSWNDFGCYGNKFVKTPNINSLAKQGVRFDNAILTASSCSPSRISIMTGRYPHNTGAAELHTEPTADFASIGSVLKNKGYYTGQAGKWHMGDLLRKGFHRIYDKRGDNGFGGEDKWVASIEERDKNKPFFFWFASYDAHRGWGENDFTNTHDPKGIEVPLTLVDNDSTRIDLVNYYDEIKRFDYSIGKVIEKLKEQGVYENTLLIILSDNGRPFPRDKTRLYDSGMKTPFIVHWPIGIAKGAVSNSLISSIDLAPTILDICKAAIPKSFQGKSFRSLFRKPKKEFRKYAFAEHNWHDHEAHERMARTKDFIYILNSRPNLPNQGPADALSSASFRSLLKENKDNNLTKAQRDVFMMPRPTEELFNVKNDALQLNNTIGNSRYTSIENKLRNVLQKWMKRTGDNIPKNLTKDWYRRDSNKKADANFDIRGEMPGIQTKAEAIHIKSGF